MSCNIQVLAAGGEAPAVNIPGFPTDWPHQEVAAGWGGDRLAMYENTDGRWVIEWQTAWDTRRTESRIRRADERAVGHVRRRFAGRRRLGI